MSHQPRLPTRPLLTLDPVPALLDRLNRELAASFVPTAPLRLSRAPGRLDVMGGIADYTGSLVCEMPLDRAAAVALQQRDDRQVQVFSFNLLDENKPFTAATTLDALASATDATLQRASKDPNFKWANYLLGCLYILHDQKLINLADPSLHGVNIALLSTVPAGAGISSSAAIEVATMINLVHHFHLESQLDPMRLATLCQMVENRVVGAPCGIMDQAASVIGQQGSLMCMVCQPHDIQPTLHLPQGIRVVGINSAVKHSVGGGMYGRTRCAAFMGHRIILQKMADLGRAAGKELLGDPMRGYLANLDVDDYKAHFRELLPESIKGEDFLNQFGPTIDPATTVDPAQEYFVRSATDHHVLEARRVKKFVGFLEEARNHPNGSREKMLALDKAGHLMYASHISYTEDAKLGAPECDLLVKLARDAEAEGIYGAKITGGGSGGAVAILCNTGDKADAAISKIMADYADQTKLHPEAFMGSSPGAWHVGTTVITLADKLSKAD